jgi:hypothetical protein
MFVTLFTLALVAQPTLTVTVKPSTPFTITWDQPDPVPLPSFRLWCDGEVKKNYLRSELTIGAEKTVTVEGVEKKAVPITATAPGLTAGTHSCFVSAFDENIETKGLPMPVTVTTPTGPATPINLRIVVTVGGGGL